MIVQCNQCSTKFRINDANVGPRGAKVRCSRCQNVFTVAPLGAAAPGEGEFQSDRTHAFDTSQFMRPAAKGSPVSPPPPPTKKAPAPPPAPTSDATSVVDARAFMAQLKSSEAAGGEGGEQENATQMVDASAFVEQLKSSRAAGPMTPAASDSKENPTQMVDARAFMAQLKSSGAVADSGFESKENSTRVMNVAEIAGAPPPLPGGAASMSPHDDETRVGPVKFGESRLGDPHDQPTQVAAASPWGDDVSSDVHAAPEAHPADVEEAPGPALSARLHVPSGEGARLADETMQAGLPEASAEALSWLHRRP